jgi:hypothetical protein
VRRNSQANDNVVADVGRIRTPQFPFSTPDISGLHPQRHLEFGLRAERENISLATKGLFEYRAKNSIRKFNPRLWYLNSCLKENPSLDALHLWRFLIVEVLATPGKQFS